MVNRTVAPISLRDPRARAAALGLLLAAGAALLWPGQAHAALGENASTIETDRQAIHAQVRRTQHAAFTVHEMSTGNGGIVREYVAPSGTVFAVTWHGGLMPNLRQLLGVHFEALRSSPMQQRGGLGFAAAQTSRVRYVNSGRIRSFHGSAVLVDSIPSGVTGNDIQ